MEKSQNQNGTERERKLCDWLCKKVGERKKRKKKELPNIMKYNALVLVWFGLVISLSFLAEWDLCLCRSV